jgi:hypothetical protein
MRIMSSSDWRRGDAHFDPGVILTLVLGIGVAVFLATVM